MSINYSGEYLVLWNVPEDLSTNAFFEMVSLILFLFLLFHLECIVLLVNKFGFTEVK